MEPRAESEIIAHRVELEDLCRTFGVQRLALFGSALTLDWSPDKSDFDFVVDFASPPAGIDLFTQQFGLLVQLERTFGRPIDLVERKAITRADFRRLVDEQSLEVYAA